MRLPFDRVRQGPFLFLFLAAMLVAPSLAQNVAATLNGTLRDSSAAVIVGGLVTVAHNATGATRMAHTNAEGYFVFTDLQPGSYAVTVEVVGFKKHRQNDLTLTAGETRTLGNINMAVGEVAETVTVEANTAQVQLASGEKSGVITGAELDSTALRGRDYLDMLRLLPGVVDENEGREAPGPDGTRSLYINGARDNQKNITVDGISSMDTGSNVTTHTAPALGTIAEVKVLTSNYQAEFGRSVGGTVIVTTRGGGRQYRGSAFWSHRHEGFNANDYFNNQSGLGKTPYRYNLAGWQVGGPVWPKNRGDAKVFFFFNQEFTRQRVNYPLQRVRMPTTLERGGDFSQTVDLNGNRITVYDPVTAAPFAGNIIPRERQDKNGQAILNMLPVPNYTDPDPLRARQWNYLSSLSGRYPKRQDMIRVDLAPSVKWQIYVRFLRDIDEQHPPYSVWVNGGHNFPLSPLTFKQPGKNLVISVTRPIAASWFNDLRLGYSMNRITTSPDEPEKISRKALGLALPQWRPELNPEGYIPSITFGTPGTAPNASLSNNMPYKNVNHTFTLTENLSKIHRTHTIRMGVYIERARKDNYRPGTATRGAINFGDDAANPLRTRYGFASALMGIMTSYQESTAQPSAFDRFTNLEWYIQDNWKVSRRLSLDYGIRFYRDQPVADVRGGASAFVQGAYDRKNAPVLITSGRNAAGARIGVDPLTGAQFNAAFVGTFAPGHGDPAQGMVTGGTKGFPLSLYTFPALLLGPRLGFAYDLFGDGKTAVRGGFGIFFDRPQGGLTVNMAANPPAAFTPTLYYSTFADLTASANSALLAPSTISHSLYGKGTQPSSYQYSLSIGRQLSRFTLFEVSYVGNFARHLLWQRNVNPVPVGAQFLNAHPENRDPTTNAAYSVNFLRPYVGYGDILEYEFAGTSNYNALQAAFQTRMKGGLEMRASYTFSKALGSAASDTAQVSPFFDPRQFNYGRLAYSRDQILTLTPNWRVPKAWLPTNRLVRVPLQGWEVYLTAQFSTGQPYRPSLATTDGMNFTGTPSQGAQVQWVGPGGCTDPNNCSFAQQMARPALPRTAGAVEQPYWGNLGVNPVNRPGINNWDMRLVRRVNLFSEKRSLEIRGEAFNLFNHTQFSNIDTNARFDQTGKLANLLLGTPNAARRPRFISLGLKVNF
jgi:hypothetical protein